jgi:hypothetical protein
MRRLPIPLAGAGLLWSVLWGIAGCEDPAERNSQRAVRDLVKAKPEQQDRALDRVVALGRQALTDIEQEMHSAKPEGRVRLLHALRRIGQREALPLVRFIARWAEDPEVRRQAIRTQRTLAGH